MAGYRRRSQIFAIGEVARNGSVPPVVSWLRSLPTTEAVGAFAGERYGLTVRSCVLVRSLANEVYQVAADDRRYAFKLYRHGGRSVGEVAWEQDLVAHVIGRGVACAAPVPLPDGSPCGEMDAPEGPRPFALSEWVEGTKPQPPAGDDLFRDFGRLIGRFHAAGADFRSGHPRRPASLSTMLDEPLRAIAPHLDGDHADRVAALAARAREELSARELSWGVRHGDVSLDNIHRTGRGLVLHDFDLAGPGWLAADLTGVQATEHWHAFADGYTAEHPLPDLSVIPWLEVCELIGNLRFHLVEKPQYRGLESLAEGWADRALARVGELSAQLL
jgi:Ser/Thr protein kinase RdoA (MazF antagonist)